MPLQIPMSSPDLGALEIEIVGRVIKTGHLSIGPHLAQFEKRFASYIGTTHAIGVSSGTAGLHLCIMAAGVAAGDLVITTPYSFIASANVILYERAVPIFVDVDERTGNIDADLVAEAADDIVHHRPCASRWLPRSLRSSLSQGGRLAAILPVHAFGRPCDIDKIGETARHHGVPVIEDACEATGAEYKGRKVGAMGNAAVFAFYPNKQMTTGEGGMIVTDSDDWNDLFRSLRNQGRDSFDAWLKHDRLGFNYRMNEINAAIGLIQVGRIEELLANRERVAQWYSCRLRDLEAVQLPAPAAANTRTSWFVYVIQLAKGIARDAVMRELAEKGIPSRCYFSPIHIQPYYIKRYGYQRGDFPVAEALGDSCLALPFSGVINEEQVDYVCKQLAITIQNQLTAQ